MLKGCSSYFISFKSIVITLLEYDPKFKPFNKSTDVSTVIFSTGVIPVSDSSSNSSASCPATILVTGSLVANESYETKNYK